MEKLVFQSVFFPEAAVKLRIPVFRISRKRMTDAREMATDLMALSGHQLNLQQRTASSGTERPVCGFYVNSISLLLSLNRNTVCPLIFCEVSADPLCLCHGSFYNRQIVFSNSPLCDQSESCCVAATVFPARIRPLVFRSRRLQSPARNMVSSPAFFSER